MDPRTKSLLAVDVGHSKAYLNVISQIQKQHPGSKLTHILSTHHHADHIGGNDEVKSIFPEVEIVTGLRESVPHATKRMKDLDTFEVGELCICCMDTPGHTKDHVSFIVTHVTPESTKIPFLFCGDTMFISGCGRVFDGTAEQLFYSL